MNPAVIKTSGETPPNVRQAKVREVLALGGGKRMSINVPGEAVDAIHEAMRKHGHRTSSEVIIAAVLRYARATK